ncbi:MAG: hypothetical protein B6229_03175 [Spirochaetaceae bacterium 4572_7]|nr:MAG: hypothetical protein B6229_03175 [Spirochaetaceae bacterium 4572_7]
MFYTAGYIHDINVSMKLEVVKSSCSLYKLDEHREVPRSIYKSSFFNVTRTDNELSIICDNNVDMPCSTKLSDLKVIKVVPITTSPGDICKLISLLNSVDIKYYAISTLDDNYIIVQDTFFELLIQTVKKHGYNISGNID